MGGVVAQIPLGRTCGCRVVRGTERGEDGLLRETWTLDDAQCSVRALAEAMDRALGDRAGKGFGGRDVLDPTPAAETGS